MKKLLLTLTLVASLLTSMTVFAHDETATNDNSGQQQTATVTEADFNFTTDATNTTVTLQYADGSPLANAAVTVKNSVSGADGDIVQNQSAGADGTFNYGEWVKDGVAILRVTDPVSNNAIEYNIENGTMTIEAGKGSKGDGGDRTAQQAASQSNTYIIIGVVVAVLVIATIVVINAQKKKKAAFEAENAKKKGKKSKKSDKEEK